MIEKRTPYTHELPQWAVEKADDLFDALVWCVTETSEGVGLRADARDLIARALADAAKPKWQPVGDEHKDGDWWLGCYAEHYTTNGFAPIPVRWGTYHPNSAGKVCWRTVSGHKVWHITHVMPLPAAPEVG